MNNFSLVLKNCNLVNENSIKEVDIGIKDDRIEKIASQISSEADEIIDLEGKYIAPGIIDDQVHFRDPGLTEKGDIRSESLAAVYSGVTSTFDMPNVNPNTTTIDLLNDRNILGANKSWTNYSYYFGATETNLEEIKKLNPKETCGLKVFMGTSTGTLLVEDDFALEQIFQFCPVTIVTHCEDNETIKLNSEKVNSQYQNLDASFHPIIRNDICCYKSSSKVIDLAKKYSSDLHVLHLTTKKEIELFENIDLKNKKITCEVCVHHLWFDERDYKKQGNFIVCNPAIKKVSDRDALRKALKDGFIDYVATDHAPHSFEDKKLPYGKAPAGIPLIEHSFHMMIELHKQGFYSLSEVISYMSHKVADRFCIQDRGYVREGYKADFVMFDLDKTTSVTNETEKTKCRWSPFDGHIFNSSISGTIINGKPIVVDGVLIADVSSAEKILFNRE
jgi:dihydroorotase